MSVIPSLLLVTVTPLMLACKRGKGLTVTAKVLSPLVPKSLVADTVMFPFCPAVPVVTVIECVSSPPVIIQPVGTVQL